MASILDTDHLSVLHHETQPAYGRLQARLQQHAAEAVQVTIVSFQEQVQGWLAYINKTRQADQILRGYAKLLGLIEEYSEAIVLPFDDAALDRFNDWTGVACASARWTYASLRSRLPRIAY